MNRIINFNLYPVNNLGSDAAIKWIEEVKNKLDQDGSCVFPEFVESDALTQMVEEVNSIKHLAYPGPKKVSPYFFNYRLGEDQNFPDTHPTKRKGKRNLAQVAADLIPAESLLSRLYHSSEMLNFLSAIFDQPIYLNQDPYQSLNISVMNKGGCQQWHFDSGKMVTTLLLQQPKAGGIFEYAPAIRSDVDENFDTVEAILDGDHKNVKKINLNAGTLSLFRGHYSLHRVTEVDGHRQRLQAILGYTTQPGYMGSKDSSILHYGPRVEEIESVKPLYLK